MARELNHSHLALPSIPALKRKKWSVEVWNDDPGTGEPRHVTLGVELETTEYVDLLPSEARALAALLIAAADGQDALSKGSD